MPTEREMKTIQQDKLYDLMMLAKAEASKRNEMLKNQIIRAENGMTEDEIAHVRERVARSQV